MDQKGRHQKGTILDHCNRNNHRLNVQYHGYRRSNRQFFLARVGEFNSTFGFRSGQLLLRTSCGKALLKRMWMGVKRLVNASTTLRASCLLGSFSRILPGKETFFNLGILGRMSVSIGIVSPAHWRIFKVSNCGHILGMSLHLE